LSRTHPQSCLDTHTPISSGRNTHNPQARTLLAHVVVDSEGKTVETLATPSIQGPWDSTAKSEGSKTTLFVSNALNGGAAKGIHTIDNSTVLRIELESGEQQTPKVLSETVIANGIPWVDSAEALVLGPTGLALASDGTLYVASTDDIRSTRSPKQ
jgi:hypothetical protein